MGDVNAILRRLPSVDEVLRSDVAAELLASAPRWAVLKAARLEIERLRRDLLAAQGARPTPAPGAKPAEEPADPTIDAERFRLSVKRLLQPSLVPIINCTGVVLHTNLGRAPLHPAAVSRVAEVARGYSNLEYELDARRRGSRHDHVSEVLCELSGAEAACVVNNNAGAVLVALATLAAGKEVIVSRGELVEIGGSFRVPDVMRASAAKLVEVGTTNKTRLADYRDAITPETGLLLKVHRSNFALVGFTEEVSAEEMAALGREQGIATMIDLGSGSLTEMPGEPTVPAVVRSGVEVVTFSGDKLLGGPQAGILVGRSEVIARIRKHPLMRALRCDKMTLAALEATLDIYRDGNSAEIPAIAMLKVDPTVLRARAERLLRAAQAAAPTLQVSLREVRSAVGGGALPLYEPSSWAVALEAKNASPEVLDRQLRAGEPPIVGRISDGVLLLDVRCVYDDDIERIASNLSTIGAKNG